MHSLRFASGGAGARGDACGRPDIDGGHSAELCPLEPFLTLTSNSEC